MTGITKTNNNHQSIMDSINPNNEYDNFHLCTMDDVVSKDDKKFKNIVFCAPPSGFDDYPSAIQNVIDTLWVGGGVKEEEGNCDDSCAFIFTSSGGM